MGAWLSNLKQVTNQHEVGGALRECETLSPARKKKKNTSCSGSIEKSNSDLASRIGTLKFYFRIAVWLVTHLPLVEGKIEAKMNSEESSRKSI